MPRNGSRTEPVQELKDIDTCIKCEQPMAECNCERDGAGKLVF